MSRRCPLMTVALVLAVALPAGAQTAPAPYIFWTEPSTGWIKRLEVYNPQAPIENVAEGPGAVHGIAYIAARHSLFIADSTNGDVVELSYVTGQGNTIFNGSGGAAPWGLTGKTDPEPLIVWTDAANGKLQQWVGPQFPVTDLVTNGLLNPVDLYIDTLHELIYIADGYAGDIKVTDLAGITNPDPFIPHTSAVLAIVGKTNPEPFYPVVYFGDEEGSVLRADLDMTVPPDPVLLGVVEVAAFPDYPILGLALDEDNGRLFVVHGGAIHQMDVDGSNQTLLVSGNKAHKITYVADFVDSGPGDTDLDGDIDLDDHDTLVGCFSGPLTAYPPGCLLSDFDGDGDVDLGEFGTFIARFTGPG